MHFFTFYYPTMNKQKFYKKEKNKYLRKEKTEIEQ